MTVYKQADYKFLHAGRINMLMFLANVYMSMEYETKHHAINHAVYVIFTFETFQDWMHQNAILF